MFDFRRDPNGALLAFADMMQKTIVMPAHFMDDGCHGIENQNRNLFDDFAFVAEDIGVYTPGEAVILMYEYETDYAWMYVGWDEGKRRLLFFVMLLPW